MNDRSLLIIVSGPPASGKTTIALLLGSELGLPVLCKDQLKEFLADNLNVTSLEWSRLLGSASFELLYFLGGMFLRAGVSLVLEANFRHNPARNPFEGMLQVSRTVVVECTADSDVLMDRYQRRHRDDERHQIHVDLDHLDKEDLLADWINWPKLGLDCPTFEIDSTDPSTINLQRLVNQIKRLH